MGFRNSFAQGVIIARNALQSINFAAGVSGWRITRQGDAEFNNALVRGELVVGDASGEIVIDQNVPAGLNSFYSTGTQVADVIERLIVPDGDYLYLIGGQNSATPKVSLFALGAVNAINGHINEAVRMQGDGSLNNTFLMIGENPAGTPVIFLGNSGASGAFPSVTLVAGGQQLFIGSTLLGVLAQFDIRREIRGTSGGSNSLGRGLLYDQVLSGAPLATAGPGAEVIVFTTPTLTFLNNRAYRFTVMGHIQGTVAAINTAFRLRAGTLVTSPNRVFRGNWPTVAGGANVPVIFQATLINTSGADISQQMSLTMSNGAGAGSVSFTGTGTAAGQLTIEDVGEADNASFAGTGPDYSTENSL